MFFYVITLTIPINSNQSYFQFKSIPIRNIFHFIINKKLLIRDNVLKRQILKKHNKAIRKIKTFV